MYVVQIPGYPHYNTWVRVPAKRIPGNGYGYDLWKKFGYPLAPGARRGTALACWMLMGRKRTRICRTCVCVFFLFLFHPTYYPRTSLALPPSSNSDPGSHSGLFPPPSPLRYVPSFLSLEKIPALASVVDSRRIVLHTINVICYVPKLPGMFYSEGIRILNSLLVSNCVLYE